MDEFRGKDHFPGSIVDQGETGRLAARIDLEPEWVNIWLLDSSFQHDRERVAFEHSSFARCE